MAPRDRRHGMPTACHARELRQERNRRCQNAERTTTAAAPASEERCLFNAAPCPPYTHHAAPRTSASRPFSKRRGVRRPTSANDMLLRRLSATFICPEKRTTLPSSSSAQTRHHVTPHQRTMNPPRPWSSRRFRRCQAKGRWGRL